MFKKTYAPLTPSQSSENAELMSVDVFLKFAIRVVNADIVMRLVVERLSMASCSCLSFFSKADL